MPAADPSNAPHLRPIGAPRWRSLLTPYLVIAALLAAYAVFWVYARAKLETELDRRVQSLRTEGYDILLSGRRIDGFPFRLRLSFNTLRIVAPSGWGVQIPRFEAQAYLHAPGHWVLIAPSGLQLLRARAGSVKVSGLAIRASVAGEQQTPWRLVFEGVNLRFRTGAGVQPFAFVDARRFDALLRPAPDRSGAQLLLRLTGAQPSPGRLPAQIMGVAPLTADLALRLTRPAAFEGASWNEAARRWSAAGGQAQVVRFQVSDPAMSILGRPASLSADAHGRWAGELGLTISRTAVTPQRTAPAPLVANQAADADLDLAFRDGGTWLGPVRLGPAPQLFTP